MVIVPFGTEYRPAWAPRDEIVFICPTPNHGCEFCKTESPIKTYSAVSEFIFTHGKQHSNVCGYEQEWLVALWYQEQQYHKLRKRGWSHRLASTILTPHSITGWLWNDEHRGDQEQAKSTTG